MHHGGAEGSESFLDRFFLGTMNVEMTGGTTDEKMAIFSYKTSNRAVKNISKWGFQDKKTLIIAMMEELGEIAKADLDNEGDERVIDECIDLGALCLQLECVLSK